MASHLDNSFQGSLDWELRVTQGRQKSIKVAQRNFPHSSALTLLQLSNKYKIFCYLTLELTMVSKNKDSMSTILLLKSLAGAVLIQKVSKTFFFKGVGKLLILEQVYSLLTEQPEMGWLMLH